MNSTRTQVFLALSIVAILLVAASFLRRDPAPVPLISDAPAVAKATEGIVPSLPSPAPASRSFTLYRWKVGERGSWRFSVSLKMAGAADSLATSEDTQLGGILHLVVLEANGREVRLGAAITDAWFQSVGERVELVEQLLNSHPAILRLGVAGNLMTMALPSNVPEDDRNILRLAYGWEWVARDSSAYEETEAFAGKAAAQFRAAYRRLDDTRIRKRRDCESNNSVAAAQHVLNSEFEASIGKLWIHRMSGWEDTSMWFNGTEHAVSRIAVSFEQLESAMEVPALNALLQSAESRSGFTVVPDPKARSGDSVSRVLKRKALAAQWAEVPFNQVFAPLQSTAEGPAEDVIQPLQNLEEWLQVHANEGANEVIKALWALPEEQTSLSGLLVHALAGADTEFAREAIRTILMNLDSFSPSVLIQAAVAAGDAGAAANSALKQRLYELLDSDLSDGSYDLSGAALFSFARLAKHDTDYQRVLLQRIAPWLAAGATDDDTVKALNCLGNAGVSDLSFVTRARELAQAPHPDVRVAAEEFLAAPPESSNQ